MFIFQGLSFNINKPVDTKKEISDRSFTQTEVKTAIKESGIKLTDAQTKRIDDTFKKNGTITGKELKSIFGDNLFKQFQEWYVNTYIKQKMTDKAKEAQSPFMQNPDPNLVYAQGAGLSKQQEERRSNDLEIAEGFFINKKEKDKKKAA